MIKLILKRALATLVDYSIIGIYALLLWSIFSNLSIPSFGPITGQIVGFLSLTLPAFLYAWLTEKGQYKATIGKRILGIKVGKEKGSVFLRNLLKFLPWEIAHTGVHWVFYYEMKGLEISLWIWVLLILPQVLVFIYFISLFFQKGRKTLYDQLSGTLVE